MSIRTFEQVTVTVKRKSSARAYNLTIYYYPDQVEASDAIALTGECPRLTSIEPIMEAVSSVNVDGRPVQGGRESWNIAPDVEFEIAKAIARQMVDSGRIYV